MASDKKEKNKVNSSLVLHIATPFIVLALCTGIIIAASIKPLDKLKVYKNIAFMDDMKIDPEAAGKGLVIKNNEIAEDNTVETTDNGKVIIPKFGEMYALIKSSAFDVSVPVYWGCDIDIFEVGAGQAAATAVIGNDGHSVISAHEDTFFAELKNMKKDDTVTVLTNYGVFTYKVKELITFNKNDTKYVAPSKENKLTLYTCKKDLLGSSDERIGVICEPVEKKFYVEVKGDKLK